VLMGGRLPVRRLAREIWLRPIDLGPRQRSVQMCPPTAPSLHRPGARSHHQNARETQRLLIGARARVYRWLPEKRLGQFAKTIGLTILLASLVARRGHLPELAKMSVIVLMHGKGTHIRRYQTLSTELSHVATS